MKNKETIFKVIFSICFFVLAILTMCFEWFKKNIDGKVILLIIIGFLPWIVKYIKSIEAFGMKAELLSKEEKNETEKLIENAEQEINDKLEKVGDETILSKIEGASTINPVEQVVNIRVQIEKLLKELVEEYGMSSSNNIRNNMMLLNEKNILSNGILELLNITTNIINKILHKGIDSVSQEDLVFAINVGNSAIESIKVDIELAKYFPDGIK